MNDLENNGDKNAMLDTRDLKKYFHLKGNRKLHAVDGVSVRIAKGETLGLVGESGCGKTTFGRTIVRLYDPTDGQIILNGTDITHLPKSKMRPIRREMQMIFQDPYASLSPRSNVESIIAEPMLVNRMYKSTSETFTRVDELMDIVGLARRFAGAYPHEISGGLRQRVGIARALATNPKFIVCDEPVSSLDVSIQAQIINLLMDLQRDLALSYLFISHDLLVVKHISHTVSVMYMGESVETASSEEIFTNPLHPYTKALLASTPEHNLKKRGAPMDVIRGEVSSPVDPKPGCRFAPRCSEAGPECGAARNFREITPGHFVACHKVKVS